MAKAEEEEEEDDGGRKRTLIAARPFRIICRALSCLARSIVTSASLLRRAVRPSVVTRVSRRLHIYPTDTRREFIPCPSEGRGHSARSTAAAARARAFSFPFHPGQEMKTQLAVDEARSRAIPRCRREIELTPRYDVSYDIGETLAISLRVNYDGLNR